MTLKSSMALVKEVGEEIITEPELKKLFEIKKNPIAYDGFEPSGTDIHIAQGLLRAININKLTKAGVKFKMLVADWHAAANNKFDGDLEKIRKVGDYYVEVWKACGMNLNSVEFVYASDLVKSPDYWKKVLDVSRNTTVARIIRTGQIMGRKESEVQQASQILYPCMQVADIFELQADIAQLGMDQRKVNVLAREIGEKIGFWKPIVISHHMLQGLGEPKSNIVDATERAIELKMSKSKPDTAIFMSDSPEDVARKLKKAYCPEKQVKDNPVLEYCKYILFEKFDTITIARPEKFGGNLELKSYAELEKRYSEGALHPVDLKMTVADYLSELLAPIQQALRENKKSQELFEEIRAYKVTR